MNDLMKMNPINTIARVFKPLQDLPCWMVKGGYGSFLKMEFGEPILLYGENPRKNRRTVNICGQWHLWIYCCDWGVFEGNKMMGSCNNKKSIDKAAQILNGQKLKNIRVYKNGRTDFRFEYGTLLITKPYDKESEQWMLFEPNGMVLTFNWNGCISHQPGNISDEDTEWHKL